MLQPPWKKTWIIQVLFHGGGRGCSQSRKSHQWHCGWRKAGRELVRDWLNSNPLNLWIGPEACVIQGLEHLYQNSWLSGHFYFYSLSQFFAKPWLLSAYIESSFHCKFSNAFNCNSCIHLSLSLSWMLVTSYQHVVLVNRASRTAFNDQISIESSHWVGSLSHVLLVQYLLNRIISKCFWKSVVSPPFGDRFSQSQYGVKNVSRVHSCEMYEALRFCSKSKANWCTPSFCAFCWFRETLACVRIFINEFINECKNLSVEDQHKCLKGCGTGRGLLLASENATS